MMTELLTLSLARAFPTEIGWSEAVQSRSADPRARAFLERRYPRVFAGESAAAVLAHWEPLDQRMVYYLRADSRGRWSFLATDRVFLHEVFVGVNGADEAPDAIGALLNQCARRWKERFDGTTFPLVPRSSGYPQALLAHDVLRQRVAMVIPKVSAPRHMEVCA